jgi:cysteine synthase
VVRLVVNYAPPWKRRRIASCPSTPPPLSAHLLGNIPKCAVQIRATHACRQSGSAKRIMSDLLEKLCHLAQSIGNTPLVKLRTLPGTWAKVEAFQFSSSIKVRPAFYIIRHAIASGLINQKTTLIESSSGNFALALALISHYLSLKFIAIIDANTSPYKEAMLGELGAEVIKVTERDETGGYLLSRLRIVERLKRNDVGLFHPDQYTNADNYLSYYYMLGPELIAALKNISFCVVSVSTGGTITGLSLRLKKANIMTKIVAVDVEGSVIFGDQHKERWLSGLGSSRKSDFVALAKIDHVVTLTERQVLDGCRDLFSREGILAGPSSGAAYFATRKLITEGVICGDGLFICPDSGSDYLKGNLHGIIAPRTDSYPNFDHATQSD